MKPKTRTRSRSVESAAASALQRKKKRLAIMVALGDDLAKVVPVGLAGRKHGWNYTDTYQTWTKVKQRCNNPKCQGYYLYGGRGITYEPRWEVFVNFLADMGPRPSRDYSIERRDNDKGYCKDNCYWELKIRQAANRRCNRKLEVFGQVYPTLIAVARDYGLKESTLRRRLDVGKMSLEQAVTMPLLTPRQIGSSVHRWCDKPTSERSWKERGWKMGSRKEKALGTPVRGGK